MNDTRLPDFRLPAPLGRLAAHLPQFPPSLLLTQALNLALGARRQRGALATLADRRYCLEITDAGLTLRFTIGSRGFVPLPEATPADLTISACARDFLALALGEDDPDALFFSRRLLMQGDTELGLLVKNTLDALEWPDWTGDVRLPGPLLALIRALPACPGDAAPGFLRASASDK